MLWVLRILLLMLILFVIIYALNVEVQNWCPDEYSRAQGTWNQIVYNLTEQNYIVPVEHRQPALSMKEFYAVPDRGLLAMMMKTRLTFPRQNHIGTVMRDGFHADLPEGTMWQNGKVVSGEEVRKQFEWVKQAPVPPPALSPPPPTSVP